MNYRNEGSNHGKFEKKNCKDNSITKKKQRETYLKDTIIIAQVVCRFVASSCF